MDAKFSMADSLQRTLTDATRMSIFQKMQTGNSFFDAISTTIIFSFIGYIVSVFTEKTKESNITFNFSTIKESIKSLFIKKYSISYEGRITNGINYSGVPVTTTSFTPAFRALWHDIIKNINTYDDVIEVKEFNTTDLHSIKREAENKRDSIYIVSQTIPFLYNSIDNIYVSTCITSEISKGEDKHETKIENINITLYSYSSNIGEIQLYVDKITKNYIQNIEISRQNQQFIYTLCNTRYENERFECWSEYLFESTRTFDNMFFEKKLEVIKKLEFFLNNKEWYYKMGIPYSIGFGLHGPPGTGKTSFFKCLANMTSRHIVVIPLKIIKTRRELETFFYEDRYNYNNKDHSLGFDKKIIVFEDIDCLGDIVLRRDNKTKTIIDADDKNLASITQNLEEIIQTALESKEESKVTTKKASIEDPITLDDILNLWDGLRETPGRIIGISSNHYDMLDPALIRPGRIDITLQLGNVSTEILKEMYKRYYNSSLSDENAEKVQADFYSPAEIINCFLMYKDDSAAFIDRLSKNVKF
jgi:hypothetical protein